MAHLSKDEANKVLNVKADEFILDNYGDRRNAHMNISTKGSLGDNDVYLKKTNLILDDLASIGFNGTKMIKGNGSTLEFTVKPNTSQIASQNYSGETLEQELDRLWTGFASTSGWTVNTVLTSNGSGILTAYAINPDNLLDKSATETVSGSWALSGTNTLTGGGTLDGIGAGNFLDKSATETISGLYTFSNTDTAMKNIKYDGSDTFTFKDTDDSDNAKLTIDANGIRTGRNTINNVFQLLNTNTSGTGHSDYLTSPSGLRFELYSDNNDSDKDGLMLLVDNDDFKFLTNSDFDGATEVAKWGSGEIFRFSTSGAFITDSLRIGGTSTKEPTATLDIHADTPVCEIKSTGSSNQNSQLTFSPHGTGGGIIQYTNDLFFNESGEGNVLKFTDSGIEFVDGATIVNTNANLLTITEATVACSGILTTGGNLTCGGDLTVSGNDINFANGATIVNTSADILTIDETTVNFTGAITTTGDITAGLDLIVSGNDITFGNAATIVNTNANY